MMTLTYFSEKNGRKKGFRIWGMGKKSGFLFRILTNDFDRSSDSQTKQTLLYTRDRFCSNYINILLFTVLDTNRDSITSL